VAGRLLGFDFIMVTFKVRHSAKIRHLSKAAVHEGSAGSAPTLHVILWHSPYKWSENNTEKTSGN
jgi:hypothetical protein